MEVYEELGVSVRGKTHPINCWVEGFLRFDYNCCQDIHTEVQIDRNKRKRHTPKFKAIELGAGALPNIKNSKIQN